jgi:hypothetical protein
VNYVGKHVKRLITGIRNMDAVLVRKFEGKRPLEISRRRWKYDIKKYLKLYRESGCRSDSFGSVYGLLATSCEHGNEHLGSINNKIFLGYLSHYQLFKKDWASWSCCLTYST